MPAKPPEPRSQTATWAPQGQSLVEPQALRVVGAEGPTEVTAESPDRYTLDAEQGRGGQARVLLAFDHHMGRAVAWKELLPGRDPGGTEAGSAHAARFLREARVTGQLEHPGIVPVYEVGRRADGRLYYTMRLVRGQTLAAALAACPDLAARLGQLGHFVDLCQAMAYAHSRGVVHRDLKPENVMVGPFGETVLLDWGLARLRDGEAAPPSAAPDDPRLRPGERSPTLEGLTLGTPAYMSPEQALGQLDAIDARSDVWSLGAVLYEILTGAPPYSGPSPLAIASQVCQGPPPPARSRCPKAPPELAAVAQRAMRQAPADRYPTAKALAADVQAFMTGQRVSAYSYSRRALAARFASQHQAGLAAAGLTLLATVVALVLTGLAWREESAARGREALARARAEQAQLHTHGQLALALARRAEALFEGQATLSARIYAAASLVENPAAPGSPRYDAAFAAAAPELGRWRARAESLLQQARFRPVLGMAHQWDHGEVVGQLAYAPDHRFLALGDHAGVLTLRAVGTGALVQRLQAHEGALRGLSFSQDGGRLLTGGHDGLLKLWAPGRPKPLKVVDAGRPLNGAALSPDGAEAVTSSEDSPLAEVFDLERGVLRHRLQTHGAMVAAVAWSPDGRLVATGSWDHSVGLHDPKTGQRLRLLQGHSEAVMGLAFSPTGQQLVSVGYDHQVVLWDVARGERLRSFDGHRHPVYSAAFDREGKRLATAGLNGEVRLWVVATGQPLITLEAHQDAARGLAFGPAGRRLATGGMDQVARIWRLPDEDQPRLAHGDWLYRFALSADGRLAATGGWDNQIQLHDVIRGASLGRVETVCDVCPPALTPDGAWLAAPTDRTAVGVWSLPDQIRRHRLAGPEASVLIVALSPTGDAVAASSRDEAVYLWDLPAESLRFRRADLGGRVSNLLFTADGRRLVTGSYDGMARLLDAATGAELRRFEGHRDWVTGLALSPDGTRLATGGKDRVAIVWDLETGQALRRFVGHGQWVNRVAFSPDGQRLATASDDRRVILWDVETGQELRRFLGADHMTDVAFTPDGQRLAVGDARAVLLYPLVEEPSAPALERLAAAEAEAGRRLAGFELVPLPAQAPIQGSP